MRLLQLAKACWGLTLPCVGDLVFQCEERLTTTLRLLDLKSHGLGGGGHFIEALGAFFSALAAEAAAIAFVLGNRSCLLGSQLLEAWQTGLPIALDVELLRGLRQSLPLAFAH